MNLLDMLSGGQSPYDPSTQLLSDDPPDVTTPANDSNIHYLPAPLTTLQRHLLEVVLSMFRDEIRTIAMAQQRRTSISSLVDTPATSDSPGAMFSNLDKVSLLFEQMMVIDKHPSMLVDHFIPRKLILSELNERVLTLASKLQMVNHIVDSVNDELRQASYREKRGATQTQRFPRGYHMLLVAQTTREIELVEGLLIGKDIFYQNLSNSKLYEDGRGLPESIGNRLVVYMITSSQLYNNYIPETIATTRAATPVEPTPPPRRHQSAAESSPAPPSQFNVILSLDNRLDPASPSLELLRPSHHKVPMLVPMPLFSIEHVATQISEPSFGMTEAHYQWQVKVIEGVVMNLANNLDARDFYLREYGPHFDRLVPYMMGWENGARLPDFIGPYNQQMSLGFSVGAMLAKLESLAALPTLRLEGEPAGPPEPLKQFDYESFKSRIAEILNNKLAALTVEAAKVESSEISGFRFKDTTRQLEYDASEDTIADNWRQLKRLNEDATTAERKQARTETYHAKYSDKARSWRQKLAVLDAHAQVPASELDKASAEQQQTLEALRKQLEQVEDTLRGLDTDYDQLRTSYQSGSAEAMGLSQQLQALQGELKSAKARAEGPGAAQLPALVRKDTAAINDQVLARCQQENALVSGFLHNRIDRLLADRQNGEKVNGAQTNGRRSRQGTPA
ncbi:hypothetical protein DICA1_E09912 [Diutina catenulata]